ncbi:MAG: helix-turn-helix transcriptional regulator [Halobacteriovoraceae bacterium]|nr:helix-turn-helix transcriptional regulator [Halobacteriovoraceae bacterium]
MDLERYLKKHSLTHKEFGEIIDVSQSYVTRIIGGQKNPSLALMRRIIESTNGEVTVEDLFNPNAPSRLKKKKKTEKP